MDESFESIIFRSRYITDSPLLDGETRRIAEMGWVRVNGQPLLRQTVEGKRTIMNDCELVCGLEVLVHRIYIKTIPETGHPHVEAKYIGTYPALACFDADTKDEYIFGIRSVLGFKMRPVKEV